MLEKLLKAKLTSAVAGSKTVKLEDGSKEKIGTVKLIIESDSIEYADMAKFDPNISGTLLNIIPTPFKACDFGEMTGTYKLELNEVEAGKVNIKNISVNIKDNIPVYRFKLEFESSYCSGRAILFSLKNKEIEFKLSEYHV